MGKSAKAYSIIGGADGPTSIFIAGQKEKNPFKRMKRYLMDRRYKRKRALAEKSIVPANHSLDDTIQYMKQNFGAKEADSSYDSYNERKRNMKCCRIQREKPELLGETREVLPPKDFKDEKAVSKWFAKMDALARERECIVDSITFETFPTDFRLFIIDKGECGTLEIEVDTYVDALSASYSGDKKVMDGILKDIHLYFGVSQEDIENKTDRYNTLLAVLSS